MLILPHIAEMRSFFAEMYVYLKDVKRLDAEKDR